MLTLLFIFLIAFAIGGGGLGYRHYGVRGGVGPVGIVLITLTVLYFTGNLNGLAS